MRSLFSSLSEEFTVGHTDRATEDKMVGWHHWVSGQESEQTPGDSEEQGSLECCGPWGCMESDTTDQLSSNVQPWAQRMVGLGQGERASCWDAQGGLSGNLHSFVGLKSSLLLRPCSRSLTGLFFTVSSEFGTRVYLALSNPLYIACQKKFLIWGSLGRPNHMCL